MSRMVDMLGARITIGRSGADWVVDLPPGSDACYEGGDALGGDAPLLSPFGESYWPTWEAALDFVRLVLNQ